MPKPFVELFNLHMSLIGKKVSIISKDTLSSGVLKSVNQVVYGVKPTYNLILDDKSVLSVSGILVPYHGNAIDERVLERCLFQPYTH